MKNYTHISIVLDKSGSMRNISSSIISGFNEFINDQKKVKGKATITMAQFNQDYTLLHDFEPIKTISELTVSQFQPSGMTALLDAMGKTMEDVRLKIKTMKKEEKPNKVIFVFITDGLENCSSKYKKEEINNMINTQKDEEKWEFVFIGANQDAIQEGSHMGIRANSSITFSATDVGAKMVFSSLSESMSSYRSCVDNAYSFSEKDRKNQEKILKDNPIQHITKNLDV